MSDPPGLDPTALMLHFESLLDNCEFGFVQRHYGAEPLDLLRFCSIHPSTLERGLQENFPALDELSALHCLVKDDEYRIKHDHYGLDYHTFRSPRDVQPDTLLRSQARRLRRLSEKLIEDVTEAERIFVVKGWETDRHVFTLLEILRTIGPASVLWVVLADADHPPGTVQALRPGLFRGHIDRFGAGFTNMSFDGWLLLCRNAYRLIHLQQAIAGFASLGESTCCDIDFGSTGNSAEFRLGGWHSPEAEHAWTRGDLAELCLPSPQQPGRYQLVVTAFPFTVAGRIDAQRVLVSINGVFLQSHDVSQGGAFNTAVSHDILSLRDPVVVRLAIPRAAAPCEFYGGSDQRLLGLGVQHIRLARMDAVV